MRRSRDLDALVLTLLAELDSCNLAVDEKAAPEVEFVLPATGRLDIGPICNREIRTLSQLVATAAGEPSRSEQRLAFEERRKFNFQGRSSTMNIWRECRR